MSFFALLLKGPFQPTVADKVDVKYHLQRREPPPFPIFFLKTNVMFLKVWVCTDQCSDKICVKSVCRSGRCSVARIPHWVAVDLFFAPCRIQRFVQNIWLVENINCLIKCTLCWAWGPFTGQPKVHFVTLSLKYQVQSRLWSGLFPFFCQLDV